MRAQHQQQQQPQQQFQQMVKNFSICIAEMNRIDTITNEGISLIICIQYRLMDYENIFLLQSDSGVMEVDMIHQERRKAMEAMEEAMNVQQQMRRYESK